MRRKEETEKAFQRREHHEGSTETGVSSAGVVLLIVGRLRLAHRKHYINAGEMNPATHTAPRPLMFMKGRKDLLEST